MKIDEVLNKFVNECSKKLNLMSIIQFGSSTHSKNPQDIDLVFFSKEDVFSSGDYVRLFKIIKDYENRHKDVVFYIAGGFTSRKGRYKLSIIPQQKLDLLLLIDPFFINNLYKDKNKKILFGENPYIKPIVVSKNKIMSNIILEVNFALRRCLEVDTKNESINFLFKSILRLMSANETIFKKSELLANFTSIYPKITLPKNAKNILNNKIRESDFKDVLEFAKKCVDFINKK